MSATEVLRATESGRHWGLALRAILMAAVTIIDVLVVAVAVTELGLSCVRVGDRHPPHTEVTEVCLASTAAAPWSPPPLWWRLSGPNINTGSLPTDRIDAFEVSREGTPELNDVRRCCRERRRLCSAVGAVAAEV